jgi:uncharacterized surface protein with fasciclin (FAS1) repeats
MRLLTGFTKLRAIAATTLLAALLPLTSHSQVPVPDSVRSSLPTIYDAAIASASSGDSDFTQLVTLLDTAFDEQLDDIFDGETNLTVFGPTNAAFQAYLAGLTPEEQLALVDVQNGLLLKLLLFHVAVGDWYADTFPVGALKMVNGDLASIYWAGETIRIQGAMIMGETVLRNGIFYGIDQVIVPPKFDDNLKNAANDEVGLDFDPDILADILRRLQ